MIVIEHGRTYDMITCVHCKAVLGYTLKDIGIKLGKSKLQRDARQQNCLAKIHSYWLVFKK